MTDFKPFSIYEDDEEKKNSSDSIIPPEEHFDLGLEIEDSATQQDERTRQELIGGIENVPNPKDNHSPNAQSPSDSMDNVPFLKGEIAETLEDRAKELIRNREDSGKVRDRRKVASIFDKPLEAEKKIQLGKARWHPLNYRAQAFWFLLPAMIFFLLFYLYPMFRGFQISLTHYSPLGESVPVGWDNYTRAFQDNLFQQTVTNAVFFTLFSLALGLWPPIFLAIFLNEISYGKGLFKVIYLLPFVIPAVPAANLWKWIFDEGYGVLNSLLQFLDPSFTSIGWLTDPKLALITIVLVFVWKNTGWFMLIYFASLQNVPEEYYEAAELDGAGGFSKILNITLPHLKPVIGILTIIQVLTTFQVFTEVYVMTNGSPWHTTEVISTYIYKTAFGSMDLGYASAMAMLMFAGLFVFTAVRFLQIRKASQ